MTENDKTTPKAAGRPPKGDRAMTPAQRQKAYKARLKAAEQQLEDAAGTLVTVAIEAAYGGSVKAAEKIESATREVLMRALVRCFDTLDTNETEDRSWASTAAKGLMTELSRRYDLNRNGDENIIAR